VVSKATRNALYKRVIYQITMSREAGVFGGCFDVTMCTSFLVSTIVSTLKSASSHLLTYYDETEPANVVEIELPTITKKEVPIDRRKETPTDIKESVKTEVQRNADVSRKGVEPEIKEDMKVENLKFRPLVENENYKTRNQAINRPYKRPRRTQEEIAELADIDLSLDEIIERDKRRYKRNNRY